MIGISFGLSGCYACLDEIHETERAMLNRCRSHWAWWRVDNCYGDVDHGSHFAKGFRDGYAATAEGGDVCVPSIPPRQYWKPCYQNGKGREKINAWFEGYAHGILVASQDGAANYSEIPTMGVSNYGAHQHTGHDVTYEGQEYQKMSPVPAPASMNSYESEPIRHDREPNSGHSVGPMEESITEPMNDNTKDESVPAPASESQVIQGPAFEEPMQPVLPLPEVRYDAPSQQRYRWISQETTKQDTLSQRATSQDQGWAQSRSRRIVERNNPFTEPSPW